MKVGWETKTLGDIADVKGGKRVPKGYKLQSELTSHPYITVSDFTDDGTIDISGLRYVSSEIFEQIKRYTISSNDLYLSIAGTIGKTGYVPPELDGASLTENACKLVLHPNVDRDFIYYFTKSDDFTKQAGTNTRTAAQPKLALERLKTIRLPIPLSIIEQQRIVTILDEAFENIATAKAIAEQNLKNARALFESHLQSLFSQREQGWIEKKLGDTSILKIIDGDRGNNYPSKEDFSDDGFCLFLNTKNVRPNGFNFDITMFVTEDKDKILRKGKLQRQDVILTTRGTIGNVAIFDEGVGFENIRINSGMLIFRPNTDKILPSFLFEVFRSGIMKSQMIRYVSGAAQPQLPIKTLVDFEIPVPITLEAQRKIVASVRQIDAETQRLESIYRQKLTALDELKKSLLQLAFSGEL